jgi:hypothetical protein
MDEQQEDTLMIRSAVQKALLLAVAALFTSAAVTSCNKPKSSVTENVGSVDLALTLSPGVNVSSVSYEITGNGIAPITGSVNVADPGATISLLISGIPAGMGYTIALSATSTDGGTTCAGSAMFNITAGATTAVTVAMQCRGPAGNTGSVQVNGTTNNCPVIGGFSVSPTSTGVGGTIALMSSASDLDAGTTLTYAWSTNGGGTFSAPTSANTNFTCTPAGTQTLTLTVTDGMCPTITTTVVTCTTGGGTGGTGGGTGGTGGATGGTGGATGGTGGATGGTGGATGGTGGATGGTGGATGGTGGDPGTGGTGGATGGTGGGTGGTGGATGGTGGATGGTGGATGGTGGTGGGGPDPTACNACVQANCSAEGPGCGSLSANPTRMALCDSLFACARRTNCGGMNNSYCWCGDVDLNTCTSTAGAAAGPCLAEELAAAESTSPGTILERFTHPDYASGAAHNRLLCEFELCTDVCPPR